jgi:UDP-N-acetylmuramate dehydrogenase
MAALYMPGYAAALRDRLDPAKVLENVPLAQYTTFRIGGPADIYYEATTADELAQAVSAARELAVPFFVLGLGANILIGDRGFRGLVIRNAARHVRFEDDGHLWVERSGRTCTSSRPHHRASGRCSSPKCSSRATS